MFRAGWLSLAGLFFKEDRMSKTIRKILGEAYKFIGLAPNGILNDGQVGDGVDFANEVIDKYNKSSLFPFTFATAETTVSGGAITMATQDGESVNFVTGDIPAGMSAVYWKRSATDMIKLEPMNFKDIFGVRNASASPSCYSLVEESDDKVRLSFDALGTFEVFLVYPKKLPRLEIDDMFNCPEIYEQAIKYGVAVRAATKASLEPSVIADYQKLMDDAVRAITGSNASKRPMKRSFGRPYDRHAAFTCPRYGR